MDVQSPLNLFSTLNHAVRPPAPVRMLASADLAGEAQDSPAGSTKAFANLLDQAIEARPASEKPAADLAREKELREKFQVIVNKFFLGSMLKQMRSSPFKSEMFSGGKGGEAFQGLMDQHLAEHAGGKVAKSLVDVMVKRAMGPQGDPAQLYLDTTQQKRIDQYRQNTGKEVKHDAAAAFTA